MQNDLSDYRKTYNQSELLEHNIANNPVVVFKNWLEQADAHPSIEECNAMTLSTLGLDGFPASRIVLLKQFSNDGLVFYTNYQSNKGQAIANNNKVCLSFFWSDLERQVIIKGTAVKVAASQSDKYFNSRPKGSQLGALASQQSKVIASRDMLEAQHQQISQQNENKIVKRPQFWGGYLVKPFSFEFWQGRPNRLHDRILFAKTEGQSTWVKQRLQP